MNFLKAKNYIVVFLISFFISIGFVSAKTLVGEIYTDNSYRGIYKQSINLFEETKEHTAFTQLLYNQGYNVGNYLNSYFSISDYNFFDAGYNYGISIMRRSDLNYIFSTSFLGNTNYDSFIDSVFINSDNVTYLDGYSFSDSYYFMFFTGANLNTGTNYGVFTLNNEYGNLCLFVRYIFIFNSDGIPIGYYSRSSNSTFYFHFPYDLNSPDVTYDMTSWYAYTYKLNSNSGDFDLIYPSKFHIDGKYILVENNAGYSGVSGWFSNLIYSYHDFSDWNFNFIYEDVYYKYGVDFVPLLDYWYDSSSFIIPDDYVTIDISNSTKGYYLTPIKGCEESDYILYYSGNSIISDYKLYFNFYKMNDNDLKFYKTFYTNISKPYSNYSYNPMLDLSVSSIEFLNYSINIFQNSLRSPYLISYNSKCYSVDLATSNDVILNFDSGDFTLSNNDLQSNYNNTSPNNSTSVQYPSSGSSNIGNVNSSDIDSVINNIPNNVFGIYNSIQSLVGISTIFLTGLPVEIYGFLMSVFMIGMIIFIIKLIK